MTSTTKTMTSISMLLTILVALQLKDGQSTHGIIKHRVTVYITNNITDLQLGVHCKDKKHDIGFQKLNFGETYSFSFKPKPFLLFTKGNDRYSDKIHQENFKTVYLLILFLNYISLPPMISAK